MYQIRVKSDKYAKYKKKRESGYQGILREPEIVPVDLYGKRVNLDKNNPSNLKKTAQDIKEVYGLD